METEELKKELKKRNIAFAASFNPNATERVVFDRLLSQTKTGNSSFAGDLKRIASYEQLKFFPSIRAELESIAKHL